LALLRESGHATGDEYELSAIIDQQIADSRVAHGAALVAFVDAVLAGDAQELKRARDAVHNAVGSAAFVDVCATIASFNAVVKIADGSGIPLEPAKAERTHELREELNVNALKAK